MNLQFVKMEGAGNDYIYLNCLEKMPPEPGKLAVKLSDRHFGIGSDGLVLILPSEAADFQMRMYNIDGSEGSMCGNAIRCVGKYVYDHRLTCKRHLSIETKSGIKELELTVKEGKAVLASVHMGAAEFSADKVPVRLEGLVEVVDAPFQAGSFDCRITCLSMGNPHCVTFCEDIDQLDLAQIGPLFEKHPIFPRQVNTEFVQVLGKNALKMRVWERGSGETLACGTGACAAAAAGVRLGTCDGRFSVDVSLKGGNLTIQVSKDDILMTGPAAHVFDGTIVV